MDAGDMSYNNIPVPPNLQNLQTGRADINPITGQRLDAEPNLDLAQMTDEEKEHAAQRLFILFERLQGLGVGVENPVRTAQQSSRFEEME
jgi:Guanine nucleotide exchange factor synembryn